jgi:hypothetical protein
MKLIEITGTAILALVLGIAGPVYAQQEQQNEKQDHPKKQQEKQNQDKQQEQHAQQQEKQNQDKQQEQHAQQQEKQNQDKQQEQHAQQQEKQNQDKQQEQHAQQQEKQNQDKQHEQHAQQQEKQNQDRQQQQHAQQQQHDGQPQRTQEQQRVEQSAWQERRAHSWQSDHRDWEQRGGYHGYRIPDDRYRGYFGQEHGFRIYGLPFLVVGGYPRFQYEGYWLSPVDPWPEYWASNWYDTDDVYVVYVNNGYYLFNQRYPNVGLAVNISM